MRGDRVCFVTLSCTQVLVMSQHDRIKIAAAAQKHAALFSTERFMQDFISAIRPVLPVK